VLPRRSSRTQISTLGIEQYTMGSACPKPSSFSHALMIFDRNSPQSWRHCSRYCITRPVSDPHMVYATFVHEPLQFKFSNPTIMIARNTLVFHFEQLYRDRTLNSGTCGAPAIVENPKDCFFNFCFEDLGHIQSFLKAEFNVSSMHVDAMSKNLSAAQKIISAAAAKGGFHAADAAANGVAFSFIHSRHSAKHDHQVTWDDFMVYFAFAVFLPLAFLSVQSALRRRIRCIYQSTTTFSEHAS
jgi:hypothetical protein